MPDDPSPHAEPPSRPGGLAVRLRAVDPVWVGVAAATVAAAILWLVRLSALPLFIDEGASWWVASQDSLGDFRRVLLDQEVAPPPFYLGLRVLVEGLGFDGRAAMRLPVLLLTLPTVPLVAVVARQAGARRIGMVSAAWLAALSPLLLDYAQQVRAYGPAVTLTVLAVVLLFRAEDRGWGRRDTVLAGLALGAAPWIHYVAFLPLGVVLLWRLPGLVRGRRWTLLVPLAILWAAALAFAKVQFDRVGPGLDGITRLGGVDLQRVLATAWDGRYAQDTTLFWIALPALVVVAVVALLVPGRARILALAGLAGPLAIVVLSATGPDIVNTRYLTAAAPFLLVAVALAADRFRPATAAVAVLLVVGAVGVARSLDLKTGSYPNAEAVLQGVVPDLRPGDVVASQDISLANWLPSYIAERSGIRGVTTAWGDEQTGRAACAARRIRQIVPGDVDRAAAVEGWRSFGYRATIKFLPTPGYFLVSAEPVGPQPRFCATVAGARTAGSVAPR